MCPVHFSAYFIDALYCYHFTLVTNILFFLVSNWVKFTVYIREVITCHILVNFCKRKPVAENGTYLLLLSRNIIICAFGIICIYFIRVGQVCIAVVYVLNFHIINFHVLHVGFMYLGTSFHTQTMNHKYHPN